MRTVLPRGFDVDDFKNTTQRHGIPVANQTMKWVEEQIIGSLRVEDVLVRYSIDRFTNQTWPPLDLYQARHGSSAPRMTGCFHHVVRDLPGQSEGNCTACDHAVNTAPHRSSQSRFGATEGQHLLYCSASPRPLP